MGISEGIWGKTEGFWVELMNFGVFGVFCVRCEVFRRVLGGFWGEFEGFGGELMDFGEVWGVLGEICGTQKGFGGNLKDLGRNLGGFVES